MDLPEDFELADDTETPVDSNPFSKAIRAVAEEYDADVFIYSAPIDHRYFGKLVQEFPRSPRQNVVLIMTTTGGLANAAYQIARFMQNQYDKVHLFIPAFCKSAGTLVAIGAHELIMTPFSELGPLDVQLFERDEIGARKSGLLTHSAFEALREETFALYEHFLLHIKQRSSDNISFPVASSVAGDMAAQVMSPIYAQISPNVLGSDHRDLRVAIEYGRRLAIGSQNIEPLHIKILTERYPSHDFIIDQQEAEKLFNRVVAPEPPLLELISHLQDYVFDEREEGFVVCLTSILGEDEDGASDGEEEGVAEETTVDEGPEGDSAGHSETR